MRGNPHHTLSIRSTVHTHRTALHQMNGDVPAKARRKPFGDQDTLCTHDLA